MERTASETTEVVGKRVTWTPLPIQTGDQGVVVQCGDDTGEECHKKQKGNKEKQWTSIFEMGIGKKKRGPCSPKPAERMRQDPDPKIEEVAGVKSGTHNRDQVSRDAVPSVRNAIPNGSAGGSTTVGVESISGVSSTVQTRGTVLELAGKVKRRPVRILLDSGSTGNFVSAQVCTALKLKIEKDEAPEELSLADGSMTQTEGRVQFKFKCGEYVGTVRAGVFPHLHKEMILGIPWLKQENPQINWTQGIVLVEKENRVLSLPLVPKGSQKPRIEEINMCSAKQINRWFQKGKIQYAFLGMVREVEEEDQVQDSSEGDIDVGKLLQKDLPPQIKATLEEYADVFPKDLPPGLPPVRMGHEFKIDLEDEVPPIHRPIYKLSPLELEESKKQIEYMLEHGFIRPSQSPYGAPVLFAPKKDGGLRFCIDYRWLNKKTVKNRYPIPLPEEMFDRLGGSKIFSKIDLRSGYWQVPIRPGDIQKTAFKTRWGLYEYMVMPFGLTNAPAQFMGMMNDLLGEYLDKFVLVFLDDILVYSRSIEEHAEHLKKVFQKLRDHRLFAKASKCDVATTTIEFLGQQITPKGMAPTEAKLRAVREWERPRNVHEVRSFLGFANYYRRFVRMFAHLASPLTELTKKGVGWQWGPFQRRAFQELKDALCAAPILQYPEPTLPYSVVTDASKTAVGGILMQDRGEGLRPLAFLSRRLKPSETRYSAYERELAAVAYCFVAWQHYLEGCPKGVTVVTDHQTLTLLMEQPVLSRSQTRWVRLGLFQSIMPKIQYQPGKANIIADALSRSQRGTSDAMAEDWSPSSIIQKDTINALTGITVTLPASELRQWRVAYEEDPKLRTAIQQLRQHAEYGDMQLNPQGLLYVKKGGQRKIVVPWSLRQKVLKECHDLPSVGHVGIRRTLELVERQYHWRGMRGDITSYVRTCPVCQEIKSDNRAKAGLLQPLEIPSRKWAQVTTDLVTDLPESDGFTAIAIFVDRMTKMVHLAPCTKEITAPEYAKLFVDHVFRLHGLPEVIISDRDPRFISRFWKNLFSLLGTDLRFSTAFHPQTDGQSERMIQTMENFLRPYVERQPHQWSKQLSLAEFAANNAVNTTTGYSPFFLQSGDHPVVPSTFLSAGGSSTVEAVQEMVDRMKAALENAQTNLAAAQHRMKEYADRSRRDEQFRVGTEVALRTQHLRTLDTHLPSKLRRRWIGPFKVTEVISPVAYRLGLPPGWKIWPVFHVSNLKRYHRSDEFVRMEEPPPSLLVDEDEEYIVEGILRHKGEGAQRRYLVLWAGYPLTEATWEPESHLDHALDVLADYLRRVATQKQKAPRNRGKK